MWVRLLSHAEHPRVGRDSLQHTPPLLGWCRQHSPLVHQNDLFSRPKYQSGANLVCPTIKNEWWCCLGHLSPSTQDAVLRIDFCSDQNSICVEGETDSPRLWCSMLIVLLAPCQSWQLRLWSSWPMGYDFVLQSVKTSFVPSLWTTQCHQPLKESLTIA